MHVAVHSCLDSDDLLYLSEFKSNGPQRGMEFMPRRALSISDCEIARAFKVSGTAVDPISFIVPRKVCLESLEAIDLDR